MSLVKWLRQAPLPRYVALTFAWSWACWGLSPAIQPQPPWLARCLRWRIGWGWWTFGLLLPVGAPLGSDPLPILFDGRVPVRGDRIGSP